jgi:O-antigen ligase
MELTPGHYAQLIIACTIGIVIFASAYLYNEKFLIIALIFMIPFQLISSRFGSLNMMLIYLLGFSLFISKKLTKFPLAWTIVLIIFSYIVTLSQLELSKYPFHIIYIISIFSNFFLFVIVYNFIMNESDPRLFFRILVSINICVIIYALIQMAVGFESYALLDIGEFTMETNKDLEIGWILQEKRLMGGPFAAPGTNAIYLAIQVIILSFLILYEKNKAKIIFYIGLCGLNFMIIIATGNRGGFISLMCGLIFFFMLFRHQLGYLKITLMVSALLIIFITASAVTIYYTQYDTFWKRFTATKFYGITPDTRTGVWEIATEAIKEKPILGWGPRKISMGRGKFVSEQGHQRNIDYSAIPSPHSLYLFLLYTLGIVGLSAYLIFFFAIYKRFFSSDKYESNDIFFSSLPRLGIIILTVFLIDQIKLEFLRFRLNDFQHYMFTLFGAFVAFSDKLKNVSLSKNKLD